MKKLFTLVLTLALIMNMSSPCFAVNTPEDPGIKIYVDGEIVSTDNAPVIENSRTLAPVRAIAEKAGITVGWQETDKIITLDCNGVVVVLCIGIENMAVHIKETNTLIQYKLPVTPKIINSTAYAPIREPLEILGADVEWNEKEKSIYITSPKKNKDNTQETEKDANKEDTEDTEHENSESPLYYTGFRPMEKDSITEGAPHGLYGRIISDKAITLVRCRIVGTDMDAQLRFNAEDNITNYNVFTYFDKLICFSDAGLGAQTFEIYAATENTEQQLVFSYDYTVVGEKEDETEKPSDKEEKEQVPEISSDFTFSGFREMKNHCINKGTPHGLYGRIYSEEPITYVRCRIVGTDSDAFLRFKAEDNLKNYNVNTYFDKFMRFSDAGLGPQVFEVYAGASGGEPQLVFRYEYTVLGKGESAPEDSGAPALSFYGFRKMSGDVIKEGAPHGLYGTVVSNVPLTSVRCRIAGTDMDYTVKLSATDKVKSYSIFNYFDKLIRFSDAGLGEQIVEVYATAENCEEQLVFRYKYTVKSELDKEDTDDNEKVSEVDTQKVCLPLEGGIRLTSPYGFRAYNKWEFHKGIDIVSISGSLNILAVADGIVVDCATGTNSGAGNYVAIQHEGGWVSLYYHLKSYDVDIGDRVKMGEKFAIMGRTGGNYGVHLHFMTCDNWYGGIWATQNSHHTAPHEYVPQILSEVKYYTPNYESQNKDKIILCQFDFPSVLTEGEAFSISKSKGFLAFEGKSVKSILVTVTNEKGEEELSAIQNSPSYYTDGYYKYSKVSAKLDKLCEFDKLTCGEKTITVTATTSAGRTRVVYTKQFKVVKPEEADTDQETDDTEEPENPDTDTAEESSGENTGDNTAETPDIQDNQDTADETQIPSDAEEEQLQESSAPDDYGQETSVTNTQ